MAALIGPDGQTHPLQARTRVGRDRENELQLRAAHVSQAHAQVVWDGEAWWLYDLGSRNGTTLNGIPVTGRSRLGAGDLIAFAGEGPWRVGGTEPPQAWAEGPKGEIRFARDGLLGVPDDEAPLLWLLRTPDGWRLEWSDGRSAPIHGAQAVTLNGAVWRLSAPGFAEVTHEQRPPPPLVALHLRHSADEESIELTAWVDGVAHVLGHRAHGALLLQLARARAGDRAAPIGARPTPHYLGWVLPEVLEAELGVTRAQLNMLVYRARRHFADAGVPDGTGVIARQPGTAALRLQWPAEVEGPDGVAWRTDPPSAFEPPSAFAPPSIGPAPAQRA